MFLQNLQFLWGNLSLYKYNYFFVSKRRPHPISRLDTAHYVLHIIKFYFLTYFRLFFLFRLFVQSYLYILFKSVLFRLFIKAISHVQHNIAWGYVVPRFH